MKLLIDHRASLTIEDRQFHATPPGWYQHGLEFCDDRSGDYPEVARLPQAAGVILTV